MKEKSMLGYIDMIVENFTYKYGIITGLTKGLNIKIEKPISIEYSNKGTVKIYDEGDFLDIKANESIDIIIPEDKDLREFERELYSIIPDNHLTETNETTQPIDSLFHRINSMETIKIDKQIHLMIINSKDGLNEKNIKYVPEIKDYAFKEDAYVLMNKRLDLLRAASRLNDGELKYMVIANIKYPILSLKVLNMHDRKIMCGAIQYRKYLHYNEFDKMLTALHYNFPQKIIELMEEYSLLMAERGLII